MLETAVALAETHDAGIARGPVFAVHRPNGEDVSPYGLGLPLALVPAARLAAGYERAHGPAASQVLLAATQIAILLGVALAAALLARALGASGFAERLAALAAVAASPLWAYASSLYSEPLQALCLTAALALAVRGVATRGAWPAAVAGFCAGLAVLVKPLNLAVAPFALVPLLPLSRTELRQRLRLLGAAAAGSALSLGAWLASEIARFGRPLSSYGDQRFTNPPLDGLWRLLAGANKGLLLYFPLLALAVLGLVRLARRRQSRAAALGIAGVFGSLLALASAWWAWDGIVGWGPRLLVPAVPALAAVAAFASDAGRAPRLAALALAAAGIAVNVLGVLQPEGVTGAWLNSCGPVAVSGGEARRLPRSFLVEKEGRLLASPSVVAGRDAGLSPLRLHLFALRARLAGTSRQDVADRLAAPPWSSAHPELRPNVAAFARAATQEGVLGNALTEPFAWPRLGRVLTLGEEERALTVWPAWQAALASQAYRNLDTGRPERAEREARTLFDVEPSGVHAALVLEALRLEGRGREAGPVLAALTPRAAASPVLLVARALLARDLGNEAEARRLLAQAAAMLRSPALERAMAGPAAAWPSLHPMLIAR